MIKKDFYDKLLSMYFQGTYTQAFCCNFTAKVETIIKEISKTEKIEIE